MFLRQLEYLVALSQEEHFSRAARHCNVSQPSLSNAIKQLETEFGTPIVLRHQRFQGFTTEGSRIVEWSKRILADRDAMLQELSVLKKTLSGRLRLGAMPTSSPALPHINRHFLQLHPGVRVEVSFLGLEEMRVKLINFELDVGITYIDQKQPAAIDQLSHVQRAFESARPGRSAVSDRNDDMVRGRRAAALSALSAHA